MSPELAELVKYLEEEPNISPMERDWLELIRNPPEPEKFHVRATPLFELCSVSISNNKFKSIFDADTCIELYGHIKLIDDNQRGYYLFNRPRSDAEPVYLSTEVESVIFRGSEHCRPYWLPKFYDLELHLEDKKRDTVIVDEYIYLDFSKEVDYDKEQIIECNSKGHGLASVSYTIFQCAVIASVECKLVKNDVFRSENPTVVVGGSASATFKVRNSSMSRMLVDVDPSRSALTNHKLSWTSWLAVPAYAPSVIIEPNLTVNGEKCKKTSGDVLECQVCDCLTDYKEIVVGQWRIQFIVAWKHAFGFLEDGVLCECDYLSDVEEKCRIESDQELSDIEESSGESSIEKKPRLMPIGNMFSNDARLMESPPSTWSTFTRLSKYLLTGSRPSTCSTFTRLVELYSVSVFMYDCDDSPLLLYGTIESYDQFDTFTIFNRDMTDPILFHPCDSVPLAEPSRCYIGPKFCMELDLKDSRGREISKGVLCWDYHNVRGWSGRRISSVIPGKHGFAIVHHTMFLHAVQAKVKVVFESGDADGTAYQVYGRICTRYTKYRYFTHYDKKYYQSMLFEKRKSEFVELRCGEEVPLSKSVVSVPSKDVSLTVKANICVPIGERVRKLWGETTFSVEVLEDYTIRSVEPQEIRGSNCSLIVFVEWG